MRNADPAWGGRLHVGGPLVQLFLAELIMMSAFVATLIVLQVAGPVEAIVVPVAVWPSARTLFLAFDHCFRPLEVKDLS